MLTKETLVKIAVALLVIAIVWFILKARNKKRRVKKPRKVIVTSMPTYETAKETREKIDDDEEGYADWTPEEEGEQQEDFAEMSPVEFKSELLD